MVDILASIGPDTVSVVWSELRREAGTLVLRLERSQEDSLVAPTVSGVGEEGPFWNPLTQSLGDQSALVNWRKTDGEDEYDGEDQDEEDNYGDSEDGHEGSVGLL